MALSLAGAVALAVGARRGAERGSLAHYEPVAAPGSGPSIDDDATLEGSLRLNVDLGIGYKFALLLQDASALPAL